MNNVYIVILAGGKGERLWPLSRVDFPKQFLTLNGTHSLLATTIQRACALVAKEQILVVINEKHRTLAHESIGDTIGTLITEPTGKNTAPAAVLALLHIYQHNPEAIVCFWPADHFINQEQLFFQAVRTMIAVAQEHPVISLLGVRPTYAATGYGYIEASMDTPALETSYAVKRFHEKPTAATAQLYVSLDEYWWNIGMSAARMSVWLAQFKQHATAVYEAVNAYYNHGASYDAVPSISLDYALLEHSAHCRVVPAAFGWSDVGTLQSFLQYQEQTNPYICIESDNCTFYAPQKLVALIGVKDLCIVDTPDALLIVNRDKTEQVKLVVHELNKKGAQSYV
ncbi:MAG: sugar phosphate nucleotidyltransferase [Candidatus Babeliales bacterium]